MAQMYKVHQPAFPQRVLTQYDDAPSSEDEEVEDEFSEEEEEDEDGNLPNQEGLVEDEEYELEYVAERVKKMNGQISCPNGTKAKKGGMANPLKVLVSKKKRRFKLEGFNLDLTYVTENIIAMGYPAEKIDAFYRNSMSDVKLFFNNRHTERYRVYNLCAEPKYQYSHDHFNNNVGPFGCYDHQAPPLKLIFAFCEDMKIWLEKDPKNVAGIHCKAGKGRTGVMICCYLVYSGYAKNTLEALRYYGTIRTKNRKGVTIPSQIRYVYYFEKAFRLGLAAKTIPIVTVALKKIKIYTIPKFGYFGGCTPFFRVENVIEGQESSLFESKDQFKLKSYKNEAYIEFSGIEGITVTGDVLVELFHSKIFQKKEKMCQVWFNTSFLPDNGILTIEKSMIDKAFKDKDHKIFSRDFKIEVQYDILKGEVVSD